MELHTMPKNKQNSLYGVIIKVANLNVCRSFYRDILDLGAPVMDSNFWVEFKINGSSSLILEQAEPGEELSANQGRLSWLCTVVSMEEVVARLKLNGYEPLEGESELLGIKILKYCDPEGNPFSICENENL